MKKDKLFEALGVTPGPWENSDGMGYIFANRIGGCSMTMQRMTVANTRGYGCLQYHGEEKAHAEMEANEKLITSSPEMLILLSEIIKAQYGNGSLANLNHTVSNARNYLIKQFPEIKEILK